MFTELDYLPPLSLNELEQKLDFSPVDIQTKYNLPTEVKFCKKCVISNQRPRIQFDEEGVCSACRYWERKATDIDWQEREKELQDLCDRFRSTDGSFDVLVPSSGGKDSVYVAHILREKYNMNPLTMTWAPHLYTEIGYRNFQAKVHAGFKRDVISRWYNAQKNDQNFSRRNRRSIPTLHLRAILSAIKSS